MFKSRGAGNYAYTAARVKSKKAKLMKAEDYNKLLVMSVPEISHYISEAGYAKEMTDLATRYSGLSLLEYATYTNMAKAFRSILTSSKGELANMVQAYLTKWDIYNAMIIMRAKKFGVSMESAREDLVPAGKLNMDDLDKLLAYPTVDDTLAAYCTMVHIKVPEEYMQMYRDRNILAPVEDFFYRDYYKNLLKNIDAHDRPTNIFLSYIKHVIDHKNLETALKLKNDKISPEIIMAFFIPGGAEIDEKVMTAMANADDVAGVLSEASQLKLYVDLKDIISEETDSVLKISAALSELGAVMANKVSHMYPLSIIPVMDYMIHKENEVRNIRMIAHGVDSGLDVEIMKRLLVI